jgi:1D-myo-inositol 3-kinase
MSEPRVLSVGHVTHDLYPSGLTPGGCAYYGARVYQALGATSHLITTVGDDFKFDEVVADIVSGVTRVGRSTCFRNVYLSGELRIQRLDALAPKVDLPHGDLGHYDLLHLAPVLGEVDLDSWTEGIAARLKAVSVQGWIKAPGGPFADAHPAVDESCPSGARAVVQRTWAPPVELLRRLDAVCLGSEDLVDQGELLERLIENVPIVACTQNVEGVDVYVHGKRCRVGIYPTHEVDPTGAGDSFAAGFLYGLARGDSPIEAAQLGAAVASVVVEAEGGKGIARLGAEQQRRGEVPIIERPS